MEINKINFEQLAQTKGIEQSFEDLDVNNDGKIDEDDAALASGNIKSEIINILDSADAEVVDYDFDIDSLNNEITKAGSSCDNNDDDIDWSKLIVEGKGINVAQMATFYYNYTINSMAGVYWNNMIMGRPHGLSADEYSAIQKLQDRLAQMIWAGRANPDPLTEAKAFRMMYLLDTDGDGFISDEDLRASSTNRDLKTTVNGKQCYVIGTVILTEQEYQKLDEYYTKNGANASEEGAIEALGICDYDQEEYNQYLLMKECTLYDSYYGTGGSIGAGILRRTTYTSFTGESGVKSTVQAGCDSLYTVYQAIKAKKINDAQLGITTNNTANNNRETNLQKSSSASNENTVSKTADTSSSSSLYAFTQLEINKLNDEQEEIQKEIENKQKELETKQKKLEAKQEELQALVKEAQNSNDNSKAAQIADLQAEIKALSTDIEDLLSSAEKLESDYKTNSLTLASLNTNLKTQQTTLIQKVSEVNAVATVNEVTAADEVNSCPSTSNTQDILSRISKTEQELLKLMNINLSGCFIGKSKDGQYHVYRKGGGNIPLVARVNSYTDNAGVQNYLYNLGVVPGADGCTYSNEEYPCKTRGLAKIYQEFGIEQYHAVSTTVGWRTDYSNTELDYSEPTYSIDSINNDWTNVTLTEKIPTQISESDMSKYISQEELELCLSSMGNQNWGGHIVNSLSDCYISKGDDGKYHLYQKSTGQPVLYYQAVTNISIENPIGKRAIEALGLSATDTSDWRKVMPDGNSEIITIKT